MMPRKVGRPLVSGTSVGAFVLSVVGILTSGTVVLWDNVGIDLERATNTTRSLPVGSALSIRIVLMNVTFQLFLFSLRERPLTVAGTKLRTKRCDCSRML